MLEGYGSHQPIKRDRLLSHPLIAFCTMLTEWKPHGRIGGSRWASTPAFSEYTPSSRRPIDGFYPDDVTCMTPLALQRVNTGPRKPKEEHRIVLFLASPRHVALLCSPNVIFFCLHSAHMYLTYVKKKCQREFRGPLKEQACRSFTSCMQKHQQTMSTFFQTHAQFWARDIPVAMCRGCSHVKHNPRR